MPDGSKASDKYVESERHNLKPLEILVLVICFLVVLSCGLYMRHIRRSPARNVISIEFEPSVVVDPTPLNEASKEDFMKVKGIGKVKAEAIISFRDAIGGFDDIRQLTYADGISFSLANEIIDHFYDSKYYIDENNMIVEK